MTRQSLNALLIEKGYSIHDWAVKASVDFHTADNYLKGKTNPRTSTRAKLARALDISPDKLPL